MLAVNGGSDKRDPDEPASTLSKAVLPAPNKMQLPGMIINGTVCRHRPPQRRARAPRPTAAVLGAEMIGERDRPFDVYGS